MGYSSPAQTLVLCARQQKKETLKLSLPQMQKNIHDFCEVSRKCSNLVDLASAAANANLHGKKGRYLPVVRDRREQKCLLSREIVKSLRENGDSLI